MACYYINKLKLNLDRVQKCTLNIHTMIITLINVLITYHGQAFKET